MNNKLRICFIWQGISDKSIYGHWGDGLRGAMDILEKKYDVTYKEPWDDVTDADIILYWESPCTANGKNGEFYNKVRHNRIPKILLFSGGPVRLQDCVGFDLFLVESKISEEEFEALNLPWMRAFGVDTRKMKPEPQPKVFDAYMPATCAGWKRQALFSKAMGARGVLSGRDQPTDPGGFMMARQNGTLVLPSLEYDAVNSIYNASWCCLNTSEFWGGGQRATLEAMAAGVPVVVMTDSPKNREYVEESGCGIVCNPDVESIRKAVAEIKTWNPDETRAKCLTYIESKWTHEKYAENIIKGINKVLCLK